MTGTVVLEGPAFEIVVKAVRLASRILRRWPICGHCSRGERPVADWCDFCLASGMLSVAATAMEPELFAGLSADGHLGGLSSPALELPAVATVGQLADSELFSERVRRLAIWADSRLSATRTRDWVASFDGLGACPNGQPFACFDDHAESPCPTCLVYAGALIALNKTTETTGS